ncbi:MAG: nucleotidyltransferase family protein, partial [Synergistaceae bacterium]|nr:nucleotidyltransferase family protein [Synergistaceae bacterium]
RHPNNSLALAYIKRIREKGYPIETIAVERIGARFHDARASPGEIASATAIRNLLLRSEREFAYSLLPDASSRILKRSIESGHAALSDDRLWRAVRQAMLRASPGELSDLAEMGEGLENRMARCAYEADSLGSFVSLCTSRRYPAGRIRRYCIHMLLNLRRDASLKFQKNGPAYIRVLGANPTGRELLAKMRKSATLPVISGAPRRKASPYAGEILRFERAATEIWETLTDSPRLKAESRLVPVMS